ncbi:MAG: hypothetical protein DRI90_22620 [Deltaproteobacteria bacterium]|nr:MAG: hypothetical protein DRI90_22620 [Deltaproteobacteria bacterium]
MPPVPVPPMPVPPMPVPPMPVPPVPVPPVPVPPVPLEGVGSPLPGASPIVRSEPPPMRVQPAARSAAIAIVVVTERGIRSSLSARHIQGPDTAGWKQFPSSRCRRRTGR